MSANLRIKVVRMNSVVRFASRAHLCGPAYSKALCSEILNAWREVYFWRQWPSIVLAKQKLPMPYAHTFSLRVTQTALDSRDAYSKKTN